TKSNKQRDQEQIDAILLTTSHEFQDRKIKKYCGIVRGSGVSKGRMPTNGLSATCLEGFVAEA
ncbi:MAG: hypothetical protein P8I27_11685, partial [Pirellulaceae bacterium]|nr:hypothetical protein [Pirellulaceae bacterium]